MFLLLSLACPATSDDDDAGDDDAADDDGADDDDGDDDTEGDDDDSLPELPCDPEFTVVDPDPAGAGVPLQVELTDDVAYVYVGLSASGPGNPTPSFEGVDGEGPWTWTYTVTGLAAGQLDLAFTADNGQTPVATCSVWVVDDPGDDDGGDDDGGDDDTCIPDCSATLCGEDDGCGTDCDGGYRDQYGAVSDCRITGNCGCGIEPNDNMECLGSGQCRVRCSCDCLPPIDKDAADVAGLDFGGSCTLVFSESGDPSVWDSAANVALCPTDYDPQGPARCIECPPCHRPHPPECDWSEWCTCTHQPWYPQYSAECCKAGPQYCY